MVAHSTTGGVPNHANGELIGELRGAMGFDEGLVVTDDNNIAPLVAWGVAANASHAAARALVAGVDVDLQGGTNASAWGFTALRDALAGGLVTHSALRAAAGRVLTAKFAAGVMDAPTASPEAALVALQSAPHVALARHSAAEALVLLVNRNGTLPLSPSAARSVAVIGALAACDTGEGEAAALRGGAADPDPPVCPARLALLGPYSLYNGSATLVPTVLEAARTALGVARVAYSRGGGPDDPAPDAAAMAAAAATAAASSVAVLVLGDSMRTAAENLDRDSLDLPGSQLPLLSAVAAACAGASPRVPLVLLLLPGRPATFGPGNALLAGADALVVGWHPGQEAAAAVWALLTGAAYPSGKLPHAWPRSAGQVGSGAAPWSGARRNGDWLAMRDDVSHDAHDCDGGGVCYSSYVGAPATPLFGFGAGLSYTTFAYEAASAALPPLPPPPALCDATTPVVTLAVVLSNAGNHSGVEVLQAYIHDPLGVSLYVRAWKRLVAFGRSPELPPGARVEVPLAVSADDLALWDDEGRLRVAAGVYDVSIGGSAASDTLHVAVTIDEGTAARANACLAQSFRGL